jgi:acyl dehydratase
MTSHFPRYQEVTRNGTAAMLAAAMLAASPAVAQTVTGSQPISPTTIEQNFNAASWAPLPSKTFEQLKVGDVYRMPSRTLTYALTLAFQAVSADNNPLHYDRDYAKRHGKQDMLIQPMEVLAFTAPGSGLFTFGGDDQLIAWTDVQAKFLKDTFVDDTLYAATEIVGLSKEGGHGVVTMAIAVHNQKGELVLTGQQTFTYKLSSGG